MTTVTLIKKLNKEVNVLRKDMAEIRSVLLSVFENRKGEYDKKFVEKISSRAKAKPAFYFTDKKSFLRQIRV